VRRLREYAQTTRRLTAFGVGTLYAILKGAHLVIRQCRSWFGRFGQSRRLDKAEFERRKADVVSTYEPLPEGEISVCVDVKRVYHRPETGAVWQHEQLRANCKARYHKSGTRTDILGALAPREAQLDLECTPKADGAAMGKFLARVVSQLRAAGWRLIRLVMDNASVNTAALKEAALAPWLGSLEVHWTPAHASWLNLAEAMWSAFQRAVIQNSELSDEAAVVEATAAYLEYWCAHPREYHWPKRPREKRRSAIPPLWERLHAIPINSGTLN
jgi:DDE superfamily endonuclease